VRTHWPVIAFLCLGQLASASAAQEPAGDVFSINTCETPARDGASCGRVRWGWGDCPGQDRVACDWCYGTDGQVFAYVRRTNKTYKLSSACEGVAELPSEDVFWVVDDPDHADVMREAGAECQPERGQLICQVHPERYRDVLAQAGAESKPKAPAKKKDPEQEAADEIKNQWDSGPPIQKDGRKVLYASVDYGGATLHAVKTDGPIRIGHADLESKPLGQTVPGLVKQAPWAIGGITGTFFAIPKDKNGNPLKDKNGKYLPRKPVGPVISGGSPVWPIERTVGAAGPVPRSFLGYDGKRFFIQDLGAGDDPKSFGQEVLKLGAQEGLGGLGRLLRNDEDVHDEAVSKQKLVGGQAGDRRDARAVAGIQIIEVDPKTKKTSLVLLVQQGNKQGVGAGIGHLAEILQRLGVSDAVILDGGGSAQISIPSKEVLYRGDGRTGPTAILF
jgi:hypothetical protein